MSLRLPPLPLQNETTTLRLPPRTPACPNVLRHEGDARLDIIHHRA